MAFSVLSIRSGRDDDPDDRLYPVLADAGTRYPVALGGDDTSVASFVAKAITVSRVEGGRRNRALRLTSVRIDVFVTDARVIMHCEKYDKGGGWIGFGGGGVAVAAIANGVSKARAAARSRNKALVGHVRYPWLIHVGGLPKSGLLGSDQLRLTVQESVQDGGALICIDLTLATGTPVLRVAQDIVRRCARYRLAAEHDFEDGEDTRLRELATADALAPAQQGFATYTLPTALRVKASTASYGPSTSGKVTTLPEPAARSATATAATSVAASPMTPVLPDRDGGAPLDDAVTWDVSVAGTPARLTMSGEGLVLDMRSQTAPLPWAELLDVTFPSRFAADIVQTSGSSTRVAFVKATDHRDFHDRVTARVRIEEHS